MKKLLQKLDTAIVSYFHLKSKKAANSIKVSNGKVYIQSSDILRRLSHDESFDDFLKQMHQLDRQLQDKVGVALGKSIATDLVITFGND